ncbi:GNAT family N-acetyltransferase [Haliea sp. E17]|uniref:GNAT family N-acetyltransferase n=1 Tax=Haliea sp. E17 TaxID=3401576 RepID=UPI003AB08D90
MNCKIVERFASVDEYQGLRSAVGWHNHDRDSAEAGLQATIFFVCALVDGEVIGMGRVVGDGHIYFYVQDIVVLPEYRGRGVGRDIMDKLNQLILARATPGAFIGLMAAEGVAPLYEKFGFRSRPANRPGMEKWVHG